MGEPQTWGRPSVQTFDVVLLKIGKSDLDADPEDFQRVTVEASSTMTARADPKVVAVGTHYVLHVMPYGMTSPAEAIARNRRADSLGHKTAAPGAK